MEWWLLTCLHAGLKTLNPNKVTFYFLIWIPSYCNIIWWKYFPLPPYCLGNFVEKQIANQVWIYFLNFCFASLSIFHLSHAVLITQHYSTSLNPPILFLNSALNIHNLFAFLYICFNHLYISTNKFAKIIIGITLNL